MDAMELPVTRYALSVAYQVMGDGPLDIILIPGFMSHIEFQHELAGWTAFLRRLSKFARVITFDKRGQGLSDRMSDAPSFEQRMDDVRAIMDAVASKRATLFGHSEGCAMSIAKVFAAHGLAGEERAVLAIVTLVEKLSRAAMKYLADSGKASAFVLVNRPKDWQVTRP